MKFTQTLERYSPFIVSIASVVVIAYATIASAQTTTPDVPSTGAGGDVLTSVALLLGSGLVVVGGTLLLARRPRKPHSKE